MGGDPSSVAGNIAAHELLFRAGIVTELFCGVVLIFLVLAFYRLFRGVDRNLATLVVILGGVMPAVIDFFNAVNDAGVCFCRHTNRSVFAISTPALLGELAIMFWLVVKGAMPRTLDAAG